MRLRLLRTFSYGLGMIVGTEICAHADVGVPMIFVTLPGMVLGLIPIVLIESWMLARRIGRKPGAVIKAITLANLYSTFLGIPLTWLGLLVVQTTLGVVAMLLFMAKVPMHWADSFAGNLLATTIQAPWMGPERPNWTYPTATLILLIPFFFASWKSELGVVRNHIKDVPAEELKVGVRDANLASYALLVAITLVWLVRAHS
jgi:hypothetical protein